MRHIAAQQYVRPRRIRRNQLAEARLQAAGSDDDQPGFRVATANLLERRDLQRQVVFRFEQANGGQQRGVGCPKCPQLLREDRILAD